MSRVLTCMRCGHEGTDVDTALVDLEREAADEGRRVRIVEVETVTRLRHVEERHVDAVPERYGAEWRCCDRVACDERYTALVRAAEPVSDVEEGVSWM